MNAAKIRGFTVAEAVIYVGIASVIFTVIVSLYVSSHKLSKLTNAKNELKTDITLLTRRLESVLNSGTRDSTFVSDDGTILATQRIVGADSGAQPIWDSTAVIFTFDEQKGLGTFSKVVAETPKEWTSDDLSDAVGQAWTTKSVQILESDVSSFKAEKTQATLKMSVALIKKVTTERHLVEKAEISLNLASESDV